MSAATDSGTKTVFVRLLGEGTSVMRPTKAVPISPGKFLLQSTADYNPDDETWEFPPGSVVLCKKMDRNGETIFVAERLAN